METPKRLLKARVLIFEFTDYRSYLRAELVWRSTLNPQYSLRAFAKFLGISAANLSAVITGKRSFSAERVETVTVRLGLSIKERTYFLLLWRLSSAQIPRIRRDLESQISAFAPRLRAKALEYAHFEMIREWKYFAVLCAFREMRPEDDPRAEVEVALKLREHEFELIRDRLARLNLIHFNPSTKRWVTSEKQIVVDAKADQLATLKFHEQWLEWCSRQLRTIPKSLRYSASEWTTLDEASFRKSKEILTRALDQIQELSARSKEPVTKVYGISLHLLQLIPKG